MKILVTIPDGYVKDTFYTERSKAAIESLGEVVYNPLGRQYTPEELCDALEGVDICITSWQTPKLTAEVLKKAQSLKILAHGAGTVAAVASDALYDMGVTVLTGNPVFAESVAEGCICYMTCALRRVEKYAQVMRDGGWKPIEFKNEGLLDRTVGIVGFGMIAKNLIAMLKPFRTHIKIYSGHMTDEEARSYGAEKASINEIFETCDIVSMHSAITDKTRHMIGREQFALMRDGALFINTARGALIDTDALIAELETGRIHAMLDVYDPEPPVVGGKLRSMKNAFLMPHMAGPTIDRREYVILELAKYIRCVLDGRPQDVGEGGLITREGAERMSRG